MTLLSLQILMQIPCVISILLFALRLKQIYRDPMNRWMKILHLSYMPLYALFDLLQILNLLGVFTLDCAVWYILSMIFVWSARFIFALEMFYRAYMIVLTLVFNSSHLKKYLYPIMIIFVLCLISIIILNTATLLPDHDICIPQYDHTLTPIIAMHILIGILSVGSVAFLLKQLNYYARGAQIYTAGSDSSYQMMKLLRKFTILLVSLTMSSVWILFVSIYAEILYGILYGYDALLIIILDILLYKQYDVIFSCLCGCFLPPRPPDKVKNLQQITTLLGDKYENEFESVILETLKQNVTVFISDDVIRVITEFVQPITDLEEHLIYKPYWIPSMTLMNVDSNSIQYFTHSKYGGVPYLKPNESWPSCIDCGENLYLFLQLNMDTLPNKYKDKWFDPSIACLYSNHLLQYFQCVTPQCFRESCASDACSALIRFVEITDHDHDAHWTQCLEEYNAFKETQTSRLVESNDNAWMEHVISYWFKQRIGRGLFGNFNHNDDEEEAKSDTIYDFAKYEYETPSLIEYRVFYEGVFNGLRVISNEIEKHGWNIDTIHHFIKKPIKTDKLNGYYYCIQDTNLSSSVLNDNDGDDKIPKCKRCFNYMNIMLYQLDGAHVGFKYPNHHIGAIFICNQHPFEPQLVLLPASMDGEFPF